MAGGVVTSVWVGLTPLAMIAVALYVVRFRRIAACVALLFATKETAFITVFVMGLFFIFVLIADLLLLRKRDGYRSVLWGPMKVAGWEGWGWCFAALLGVYTILFTTFFTHIDGFSGVKDGLDYWLAQHEVQRDGPEARGRQVEAVRRDEPAVIQVRLRTLHVRGDDFQE